MNVTTEGGSQSLTLLVTVSRSPHSTVSPRAPSGWTEGCLLMGSLSAGTLTLSSQGWGAVGGGCSTPVSAHSVVPREGLKPRPSLAGRALHPPGLPSSWEEDWPAFAGMQEGQSLVKLSLQDNPGGEVFPPVTEGWMVVRIYQTAPTPAGIPSCPPAPWKTVPRLGRVVWSGETTSDPAHHPSVSTLTLEICPQLAEE